jgi:protein involved in ribonucleotide reduction
MKYLKKFNESISEEDIKDFCENGLAYLVDNDLRIYVQKLRMAAIHSRKMTNQNENGCKTDYLLINMIFDDSSKDWSEIKDHIIPFLIRLKKDYTVITYKLREGGKIVEQQIKFYIDPNDYSNEYYSSNFSFTLDQVINSDDDFILNSFRITDLRISVLDT